MTGTDGSTSNGVPPQEVLQLAARSVADGASLGSVAAWFNVPESQLEQWIAGHIDQPTTSGVGPGLHSEPIEPVAPVSLVLTETAPVRPAITTRRPAAVRPTASPFSPEPAAGTSRRGHSSPMGVRGPVRC